MNEVPPAVSHQRPNRTVLVPVSIILLTIPMQILAMSGGDNWTAHVLPLSVYIAFIILVATIQTLISMRLYKMHQLRRFVFDIPTWFLVASLLACPLAGANFFVYWVFSMSAGDNPQALTIMRWTTTVALFFLFLPIFYLTEALFAVLNRLNANGEPTR